MNKKIFMVFMMTILLLVFASSASALTGIDECSALQNMNLDLSEDYYLAGDLDCSTTVGFTPIGDSIGNSFTGSFDGKGYTISGLYINDSTLDYSGLFGYSVSGIIDNVTLTDLTVVGQNYVGGIVGQCDQCNITNLEVDGYVQGHSYTGGIVGMHQGLINNTQSNITVSATSDYTGGVVGMGLISYAIINNSHSISTVTSQGAMVGGIAGYYRIGLIDRSHAEVTVNGATVDVGGAVGYARDCYITNTYVHGTVTGSDYVAGFAGRQSGSVNNSYAYVTVTTAGTEKGGFVSLDDGSVYNSFYDTTVSGYSDTNSGSQPKTTIEMQTQDLYLDAGWDIDCTASDSIWSIDEGNDYPCLSWEDGCSCSLIPEEESVVDSSGNGGLVIPPGYFDSPTNYSGFSNDQKLGLLILGTIILFVLLNNNSSSNKRSRGGKR